MILIGVEPNYRWRAFNELVIGLARELGVELVVTLGALLADVPHTRPAPVTGSASDLSLVEELGLQASRYEGPTGIVGVLHDAFREAGIPSVSLWSAVPHYVSLAPSPRAARALCDRLGELLDVDDRPRPSSRRRRRSTPSRSPRPSPRIPRRRRTSRSSSGGPTRSTSDRRGRPADRVSHSPPS